MHARRCPYLARRQADSGRLLSALGLKVKALNYWIRPVKQTDTPLCLVPLAVQRASVSGALLLQQASGWRLVLPAGVDAAWLAGLLRGMVCC
jgi:hypothetical protein